MQINKKLILVLQFLVIFLVFIDFSCHRSTKVITAARVDLKILDIKKLPKDFKLSNTIDEANKEFSLIFEGPYQLTVNDLKDAEIITEPEDAKISFSTGGNSIAKEMTISGYNLSNNYQIKTNATLPTPSLVEIKNLPKGISSVTIEHGTVKKANGNIEHKLIFTTVFVDGLPVAVLKMMDFVTLPANIRPTVIESKDHPLIAEALVFEFDGQETRYEIENNTIALPTDFSIQEIYLNSSDISLDNINYTIVNGTKDIPLISDKMDIRDEVKKMRFVLKDQNGNLINPIYYTITYKFIDIDESADNNTELLYRDISELEIKMSNGISQTFIIRHRLDIFVEVLDFDNLLLLNASEVNKDKTFKFDENSSAVVLSDPNDINSRKILDPLILEEKLKLKIRNIEDQLIRYRYFTQRGNLIIQVIVDNRWSKNYTTIVVVPAP